MANAILLVGGPGSTKGTQGKVLHTCLNADPNHPYSLIVMGEVFRTIALCDDDLGRYVNSFTSKGLLVPDKEMLPCLGRTLSKIDHNHGLIHDGTCRSLEQTRVQVYEMLRPRTEKILTLFFDCTDDTMRGRLKKRGRDDDTRDDAIEARINAFHESREAVMNFLGHATVMCHINANLDAVEVGIHVLKAYNSFR